MKKIPTVKDLVKRRKAVTDHYREAGKLLFGKSLKVKLKEVKLRRPK